MENVRLITDGLQFPEGPIALSDGSVVLVEIKRGTLTRVAPDGTKEIVAKCGGGPNGAAIGPDGKAYVCNNGGFEWREAGPFLLPGHQPADYIGGRIQRIDLDSGAVEDLYVECGGHALRGPNDIVFDSSGGFWFSDLGKTRERDRDQGGIYWAKADGSEIREVHYPADSPNGIGLSPDGTTLYYAETSTGRVYRRTVTAPGELAQQGPGSPTSLLAAPAGMNMYDSLAVDSAGNVCVATLINGGITVVSPDGDVSHVPVPQEYFDPLVTNICFGGPDLRTAFITLSGTGRLIACDWPVPGLALQHTR